MQELVQIVLNLVSLFQNTLKKSGVDGLLIVTPYYNKTSKSGLYTHYKTIAENTSLPIILYNVPSRTGMNITPDICLELSKIKNIVAIKEASRKYLPSCRNYKLM